MNILSKSNILNLPPEERYKLADKEKYLDILVNDPDPIVRAKVASKCVYLDRLINDPDWYVRCAVAQQGYRLNKLINDDNPIVRRDVARVGYLPEKLINDEDDLVKTHAIQHLTDISILRKFLLNENTVMRWKAECRIRELTKKNI